MINELLEAAERLRAEKSKRELDRPFANDPNQVIADYETLAEAMLAELDPSEITPERVMELGYKWHEHDDVFYLGNCEVSCYGEHCSFSAYAMVDVVICTIGELRTLIRLSAPQYGWHNLKRGVQ